MTRPLDTNLTLVLTHVGDELVRAHDELYPERVEEHIPLSLTLLYPWIPAAEVTQEDVDGVGEFFAAQKPLEFSLTRIHEFPGAVVYAVPEAEDELRALMRSLWARYRTTRPTAARASTRRRTAPSAGSRGRPRRRAKRSRRASGRCSRSTATSVR